jgi:aspartyl-tRNA(Asn)/glutamyl-tRNA(Gln) amidotransferase subunit A
MNDLTLLSAAELAAGFRKKEFTAAAVARAYLERIEKENPHLNAYLEVFSDVIGQAEAADKKLAELGEKAHPLCGVPIAVKDNILIEGRIASAASKMLENHVATYDATAIAKLKEAGAVFLGRTNMDEFAHGTSTEHSAFGPTRNPHDESRVPGGSSGGSAAAVAAHLAPVALGTDTGGSIRQPASLCGIYGLKPTYGAVSRSGLIAMGSSLDQLGVLARDIGDIETTFNTVRGQDVLDSTTLPDHGAPEALAGQRIGVPRAFVTDAHPDVVRQFERALKTLATAGYEIVDIELKTAPHALAAYYIVMPAEVSTNLARFDGVRYGLHAEGKNLFEDYAKTRAEGFGPEARRRIILGTYVLSSGYYDAYYRRATTLRGALVEEFDAVFKDVSFIATPTAPNPAFKIGEKQDPVSLYLEDIFTVSANLAGVPALSAPAGTVDREGKQLPVGIQFMAPKRGEASLFQVARDLKNIT